MKQEGITKNIIGAAMAVLNGLKPGFDEKLYENAMVLELAALGHSSEQQREFPSIIAAISSVNSYRTLSLTER